MIQQLKINQADNQYFNQPEIDDSDKVLTKGDDILNEKR
jgi:hypothetical protein